MASITERIENLRQQIAAEGIDPRKGLGRELFLFASSLMPVVNVDLLVYNSKGQVLLAMRNDPHCGKGWHIPGGCVRFKETVDTRIKKVAQSELNLTGFTYDKEPIKVFEIMWDKDQRSLENDDERAHFITLVYKCYASDSYIIDNKGKSETEVGYLRWFDKLPVDLLKVQNCYREILK